MRARIRRSRAFRRLKSLMRSWTWDADEAPLHKISQVPDKTFLGVSNTTDLITSDLIHQRVHNGDHTFHREITVLSHRTHWMSWMEDQYNRGLITESDAHHGWVLVDTASRDFLTYRVSSDSVIISVYGGEQFIKSTTQLIESSFEVVTAHIEWMYTADGSAINVPLSRNNLPVEEMYPFLNGETLDSYYTRYMNSSSNILLLIGPPGTGKTTFIRGLLASTSSSALVTYDTNILEKDYVFAQFMDGDASVMVLEDSDNFLKSRSDGNSMMHRFLNVGDGLVTARNKKLVFSTNLPSVRDIDPALIRPGRCFDIVTFDRLSQEDAEELATKMGITLTETRNDWTIAEVFNQQRTTSKPNSQKVGFM